MRKIRFKLSNFNFSKRQIFVISTLLLTLGLIATQLLPTAFRYPSVLLLGFFSFLFSAFCLREDLSKHEWLTLLTLPTLFTLGVSYFYFLLPVRWITRLPVAVFYALGYYGVLLTENIFNVSAGRTIQLIRAAQTVGFYLTLITCFLFLDLLFSLHLPFFVNFLLAFMALTLLFVQYFWSVRLTDKVERMVWIYAISLAFAASQIALAISFWPVRTLTSSLFLSSIFYAFLGIGGYELQDRLFKRVALEFITVPVFVFILMFVTTSWTS
ncbi:hypothetical protein HY030_00905 [Candidatus Gottesmanbacteria bacterium]|nr:hypothetical protein [Candidatus Gottesmanbacteria bacterium]